MFEDIFRVKSKGLKGLSLGSGGLSNTVSMTKPKVSNDNPADDDYHWQKKSLVLHVLSDRIIELLQEGNTDTFVICDFSATINITAFNWLNTLVTTNIPHVSTKYITCPILKAFSEVMKMDEPSSNNAKSINALLDELLPIKDLDKPIDLIVLWDTLHYLPEEIIDYVFNYLKRHSSPSTLIYSNSLQYMSKCEPSKIAQIQVLPSQDEGIELKSNLIDCGNRFQYHDYSANKIVSNDSLELLKMNMLRTPDIVEYLFQFQLDE